MVRVCVDAMGGDVDPTVVLSGIELALNADSELEVLVAGNKEVVEPFCAHHDRASALITTETIGMGEHPAEAVRAKRDSSIVQGCMAVGSGAADGFFSAGATGAIFAAATLGVGRIKGVKRPVIATALPGASGHKTIFMDLGANADVRPETMVQFARIGRAFASVVLDIEDAKVALLSNGEEEAKGSEAVLAAHAALKEAGPWFVGNCEGTDILSGRYDVIVTDGFTGNVALKTIEGTIAFIEKTIKQALGASSQVDDTPSSLTGMFEVVAASLSGDEYGGAVLLGTKAPVVIGHGATSSEAVKNATLLVACSVRSSLTDKIASALQQA